MADQDDQSRTALKRELAKSGLTPEQQAFL